MLAPARRRDVSPSHHVSADSRQSRGFAQLPIIYDLTSFLHELLENRYTRVILKVFSVMFSTLLQSGFVLVRQSIVLCSQKRFER